LKKLDRNCGSGKVLHIIADNYSAHKTEEVKEYMESGEGRFVRHFIPAHSSRLNMVERWFAEISDKRIHRESWESVTHRKRPIKDVIQDWNTSDCGFKRTKAPEEILSKIQRARKGTNM
jgi:transposase